MSSGISVLSQFVTPVTTVLWKPLGIRVISDVLWFNKITKMNFQLDFRHAIKNLHAWKTGFKACKFSIICRQSENTTISLSPFAINYSITVLFYCFDAFFKTATAASLSGMFVVASNSRITAFQSIKGSKINIVHIPNVKNIQKVLYFWQFIQSFYRYFQTAVDMWSVHATHAVTLSCRWYDRICTLLYIHSMRMKWSIMN